MDFYESGIYGSYGWGVFIVIEPNYSRKLKRQSLARIIKKIDDVPNSKLPLLLVNQQPIRPEEVIAYLKKLSPREFSFIMEHKFVNQQIYPSSQNGMIELILKNVEEN